MEAYAVGDRSYGLAHDWGPEAHIVAAAPSGDRIDIPVSSASAFQTTCAGHSTRRS